MSASIVEGGDGSGERHPIARGTSRLLAGLFASKALDFALYLVLARGLGVEQFGRHIFAMSFTLLFSIVADLGVGTVFARESSRAPHAVPELLRIAFRAKALLGLVTLAAAVGVAFATGAQLSTLALVALFTVGMLINSTAALFESLLKNQGRAGVAGLSVVAQSLMALSLGAFLMALGVGVFTGALAYLCGAVVHLLAAAAWSRRQWCAAPPASEREALANLASALSGPRPAPLRPAAALLRESVPLALSGVFLTLYFRADSVFLQLLAGSEAVGLYGSVYRFFEALVLVSVAYRSVLFPVMARSADGPVEVLRVLCRKSFRVHLIFTIGVAAIVTVEAQRIVDVVLGPGYAAAAPALALLVWALPAAFMSDTLFHLLAAQRRSHDSARAIAAAAVANVMLNLLLIPRWSIVGAAVALVASQIVCFALMFSVFRRTVPGIGLAHAIRAPLLAGIAAAFTMAALAPVSPDGLEGMIMSGCIGGLVYVATLALLGALGRDDADIVRDLLPGASRRG